MKLTANFFLRLKERYGLETLIVGVLVFVGLFAATALTPYENHERFIYYDDKYVPADTYYRAEVVAVDSEEGRMDIILRDGPLSGSAQKAIISEDVQTPTGSVQTGDTVVVVETGGRFMLMSEARVFGLLLLVVIFLILVILIGQRRGAASVLGLLMSIGVVGWFIVPLILQGHNAFLVSVVGAYIIAIASIIISHGFRTRTIISLVCILAILTASALVTMLVIAGLRLSGISDDMSFYLAMTNADIDMRGVLAGGVVIATLGVLDDVVTTQVAAVEELHAAKKKQGVKELYSRAASVGSEHIASLVNTLALAYVGASLPVIVYLTSSSAGSLYALLNSEYVVTEVARTIIASSGLLIAVPISTIGAVVFYKKFAKIKI